MKKTTIYGVGGILLGIVGGAYIGAKTVCHVIGTKIRENAYTGLRAPHARRKSPTMPEK